MELERKPVETEDDNLEIGCSVYLDWPLCQHKVECALCGEPIRSTDEFVVLQPGKFDVTVVNGVVEFPLKTDQEDNPGVELLHQDCWCNDIIDDDADGLIAYISDVAVFDEEMPATECCPRSSGRLLCQINFRPVACNPSIAGLDCWLLVALEIWPLDGSIIPLRRMQ